MRPFKHNKNNACSCSVAYILLAITFIFVAAYGLVILAMMEDNGHDTSAASVSAKPPPNTLPSQSEDAKNIKALRGDSSRHRSNPVTQSNMTDQLDKITAVVECKTTHGPLTIDVRENWGPLGATQYLNLVEQDFFTDLPFFRVAPRYITQFGAKLQAANTARVKTIKDDKSLWGKRDMDFGYLFFAGSGLNSRHDQMVLALCEQQGCIQTALGKAPWEVPIGTVREENFDTLKSIMATGFPYPKLEMPSQHKDARGPDQGRIRRDSSYLAREYPDMAYWEQCKVVRRHLDIDSSVPERGRKREPLSPATAGIPLLSSQAEGHGVFVRFDIELVHQSAARQAAFFVVEVRPEWAPLGAQRFLELVESKFFDGSRFFRAIKGFMGQFGIAADPKVSSYWRKKSIPDDPVVASNARGHLSFAMAGPNTRTSQIFVNFKSNAFLDKQKFAPFGRVVEGLESAVDSIYTGYGEGGNGKGTDGKGPNQNMINNRGEAYLTELFSDLTIIRSVTILQDYSPPPSSK